MKTAHNFQTSIEELKQYIVLPYPPLTVKWELLTLPENPSSLPGPTDYVSLLAVLTYDDSTTSAIMKNSQLAAQKPIIPKQFIRAWLSNSQRAKLLQIPDAWQALPFLKATSPIREAIMIRDENTIIVYVNYVSP